MKSWFCLVILFFVFGFRQDLAVWQRALEFAGSCLAQPSEFWDPSLCQHVWLYEPFKNKNKPGGDGAHL